MYVRYGKRFFDLLIVIPALILLSPFLIGIAVLIRIKMGSPVLFSQERVGKEEKTFRMFKFRSMTDKTDVEGNLLPDIERLTPFGSFLRKSSIDELPAFWNVIKGEMSLIGPRPLPVIYLPYFYDSERIRHTVRGGITGWAQVNGRNALGWEEKFAYDRYYVEHVSFFFDIKIFFVTIGKIFKHADIGLRGVSGPEDFNLYRIKQKEDRE